jgi:CRP/FNR family transcriptional regulator, cyclic AMP receptor protein
VAPLLSRADPAVLHMLEKVPIFSSLTDRERKSLAKDAAEKNFPEGATIVKQGDKGIGFYLVTEGRAEVRRKGRLLAKLGPGEFFGEMALFEEAPRTADVIASEPTRCLVFSRWEFWGFAMDKPRVLRSIVEELARRLGETDRALTE